MGGENINIEPFFGKAKKLTDRETVLFQSMYN